VVVVLLLPISNLLGVNGENAPVPVKPGVSKEYAKVSAIFQNKCVDCHSPGMTRMPIYADWPIARELMQKDIKAGNKRFTLDRETYSGEKPFTPLMLNRLETVVQNDLMPPFLYLTMHWNGSLSAEEKKTILAWIASERTGNTGNNENIAAAYASEPIQPLPLTVNLDPEKVALGRKLFHDPQLSADNTISCVSCHNLAKGGTVHSRFATGIDGQLGTINSPTVFNASYNLAQFWDGRAKNLQDQAAGPITSHREMGENWENVVNKLKQIKDYKEALLKLYPDQGIGKSSITNAIAVFEKSLITPNARFDQYLRGNNKVLSDDEKEGYKLFKRNCISCHYGVAVGGQSFEKMGYIQDYFKMRGGQLTRADNGRFNVTGDEDDRHVFKVPILRNIAVTYPYFHDGSVNDLSEAVRIMGIVQLGKNFTKEEINKIVAFLKTLTGEYSSVSLAYTDMH